MKTTTALFQIILGTTVSVFILSTATAEIASIQGDQTSLRQRPDKTSTVLWELNNGFPIEIIRKQGDWVNIKDFENDSGWVHKSRIDSKPHVIVKANRSEEQSINVRSAPRTNSSIIGNAFYGVVFTVIEKKDGWVKVRHDTGLTGWVKSDLLWGVQ
jgi:SH3-like domain-containing protein